MGEVLQMKPRDEAEAWERYTALVREREDNNLWADAAFNRRLGRAWDQWWALARKTDGPA